MATAEIKITASRKKCLSSEICPKIINYAVAEIQVYIKGGRGQSLKIPIKQTKCIDSSFFPSKYSIPGFRDTTSGSLRPNVARRGVKGGICGQGGRGILYRVWP